MRSQDSVGHLTISAVYFPPRYTVKQEQLENCYNIIGCQFIAGGDYNAKHTGSRLITPRGCELLKTMERNNLNATHWVTSKHGYQKMENSE
jgi:hypothetical protein